MSLTSARASSVLSSQTAMAQKVYEYVPIQTLWTYVQITQEADRNGHAWTTHDVRGALRQLTEAAPVEHGQRVRLVPEAGKGEV